MLCTLARVPAATGAHKFAVLFAGGRVILWPRCGRCPLYGGLGCGVLGFAMAFDYVLLDVCEKTYDVRSYMHTCMDAL